MFSKKILPLSKVACRVHAIGQSKNQVGNSSKRDTRKAALYERRAKALELRKQGHTFDQIAKMMNYADKSAAARHVREAIREIIAEPTREVVEYEKLRLDNMLVGIYREATTGNLKAIDRVIKIMERRSALLGLDAPKKTETTLAAALDGAGHVVNVILAEAAEEAEKAKKK